jgi:hypothetical protein
LALSVAEMCAARAHQICRTIPRDTKQSTIHPSARTKMATVNGGPTQKQAVAAVQAVTEIGTGRWRPMRVLSATIRSSERAQLTGLV